VRIKAAKSFGGGGIYRNTVPEQIPSAYVLGNRQADWMGSGNFSGTRPLKCRPGVDPCCIFLLHED